MNVPDWHAVFVPTLPLAEVAVRGSLVYFALFAMLRLLPKRELGSIGAADLLMLVLIADAVQNAMGADYKSVTEGIVLVATILFWSFSIDWLDHRFPRLHLVSTEPLLLISDGRIMRRNLEKERITEQELMSQLRYHGIATPEEVSRAYIEGDGKLSVVPVKDASRSGKA
jgi:uncharacterized membrane protein YcaP (DUF421 family)